MKVFVSSIILLAIFLQRAQSQFVFDLNSCVTTELTSSSNGRIGAWHWQGWACGVDGTVIKSIGPSNQWRNVSNNGIPSNIMLDNICGLDSSIAFAAGHLNANTWIWKTTNGGQNWFQVFTQPNGRINAVWMRNYVQGFMQGNPVGGRWSLWKTTNGGFNWDSTGLFLPQAGNELGWPNSFCMPMVSSPSPPPGDTNKIWFGTNNYRIYYTSNYGQSWNIQTLPLEQNIFCIAYGMDYSGTTLYAGGSNKLFKSTNYGINWTSDSIGGSGSIRGITYAWMSFYLSRGNKIYISYYPGLWYATFTAPAGTFNYIDNRGHGLWYDHYAVRTNGAITFICEGEGVKRISSEIPNGFSLSQNYPNPFNPSTKIKFDIPTSKGARGMTQLIIYDVLGKEIATLVNEQLNPGTYEVEWDGSNYPSGIYFYKLITSDYSETRKMVLLK